MHRNAVLGLLLGAARSKEMPENWVYSLLESEALRDEIDAITDRSVGFVL